MKRIIVKTISLIFLAFGFWCFSFQGAKAQSATLYFSPSTYSIAAGQNFSVVIMVNSGGEDINGVTADFTYPSSLLEVVSIDSTDSVFPLEPEQTYNSSTVYISRGTSSSFSGTGEVATVNFTSVANGTAILNFTDDVLVTSADTSLDVLGSTSNSTITVGGVPSTGILDKPILIFSIIISLIVISLGALGVLQYLKEKSRTK